MLAKMLSAALVTLAAVAPAAIAGEAKTNSNSYVISLGDVDASNPAEVESVMTSFREAARTACTSTGSRIPDGRCVKAFVSEAIASVKRADLRMALMNREGSGGGMPRAASGPDRQ